MFNSMNPKGFDARAIQIKRAYEVHFFPKEMPKDMTYNDAAKAIIDDIGFDAAKSMIQAQSPHPNRRYV